MCGEKVTQKGSWKGGGGKGKVFIALHYTDYGRGVYTCECSLSCNKHGNLRP